MAIYITPLERGGFAAFGGCRYDERERCVVLDVFEDEVIDGVIEFTQAPTLIDYEEDGIGIATPLISGNTVTFQVQELSASGLLSFLISFESGAQKRVNIQANVAQPYSSGSITPTDDDDVDYGDWG